MTGAPEGLGNRDALDAFLEHFDGAPDSSGRGLFPTFSVVGVITQARLRNSARGMSATAGGPPQRAAYSTGEFNFGTTISLAFGAIAPPRTHFRVQVEPGTPIISIRLVAPASSQRRSVRPPISRYLLALAAGSAAQGHLGPNSALPGLPSGKRNAAWGGAASAAASGDFLTATAARSDAAAREEKAAATRWAAIAAAATRRRSRSLPLLLATMRRRPRRQRPRPLLSYHLGWHLELLGLGRPPLPLRPRPPPLRLLPTCYRRWRLPRTRPGTRRLLRRRQRPPRPRPLGALPEA
jgi:hypothetical protein